jgi:hypothetical protein
MASPIFAPANENNIPVPKKISVTERAKLYKKISIE